MNNYKLLTSQDYLLLVDMSIKPRQGDVCCFENFSQTWVDTYFPEQVANYKWKIVAHRPLRDDVPVLEGVLMLGEWKQASRKWTDDDMRSAINMARILVDNGNVFDIEEILGLTEVQTSSTELKYEIEEILQSLTPAPMDSLLQQNT
jgi:hypothetical protein